VPFPQDVINPFALALEKHERERCWQTLAGIERVERVRPVRNKIGRIVRVILLHRNQEPGPLLQDSQRASAALEYRRIIWPPKIKTGRVERTADYFCVGLTGRQQNIRIGLGLALSVVFRL
jgi:hypothetical protein